MVPFFAECLSKSIAFSPRLTTRGECAARTMEYKKSPITSKLASDSLLYSTLLLLKRSSVPLLFLRFKFLFDELNFYRFTNCHFARIFSIAPRSIGATYFPGHFPLENPLKFFAPFGGNPIGADF